MPPTDPVRIVIDLDDRGTPKIIAFGKESEKAFDRTGAAAARTERAGRQALEAIEKRGPSTIRGLEKTQMAAVALSGGLTGMGGAATRAGSAIATLLVTGFNPLALAIAGGAVLLGTWISKHEEAAEATKKHAAALKDLRTVQMQIAERTAAARRGIPVEDFVLVERLRKAEEELRFREAQEAERRRRGRFFVSSASPSFGVPGREAFVAGDASAAAQRQVVEGIRKIVEAREEELRVADELAARDFKRARELEESYAQMRAAVEEYDRELKEADEDEKEARERWLRDAKKRIEAEKQLASIRASAREFHNSQVEAEAEAQEAATRSIANLDAEIKAKEALSDLDRELLQIEQRRRATLLDLLPPNVARKFGLQGFGFMGEGSPEWAAGLRTNAAFDRLRKIAHDSEKRGREDYVVGLEKETIALYETAEAATELQKAQAALDAQEEEALSRKGLSEDDKRRIAETFEGRRELLRTQAVMRPFAEAGLAAGETFVNALGTTLSRGILDGEFDFESFGRTVSEFVVSGMINALLQATIGDQVQSAFLSIFQAIPAVLFGAGGGGGGEAGGPGGPPVFAPETTGGGQALTVIAPKAPGSPVEVSVNILNEPAPIVTEEVFDRLPPERRRSFVQESISLPGRRAGRGG